MNSSLFSPGETVLLIGEGNFSFAVGLQRLNKNIKITATCLESEVNPKIESIKLANVIHLLNSGVQVLLGVDGTKMAKHPILKAEKFSKIIFNFPHVGGKMKIHLNRYLLRDFFENISPFLKSDGRVLVSLCKGQGGTPADMPRRWENSWQVVEMAAHGDFVLCATEPFLHHLVPDYSSVGYRSRNTAFHTENSLIHIFKKVDSLYSNSDVNALLQILEEHKIHTSHGDIICPYIYASYHKKSLNVEYPIPYLLKTIKETLDDFSNAKYISDVEVPTYFADSNNSFKLLVGNTENPCSLRHSMFDVIDSILPYWLEDKNTTIIFPGIVFNKLGLDFDIPPISNHVLLLGKDALNCCKLILNQLVETLENSTIFSHSIKKKKMTLPVQLNYLKVSAISNIIISEEQNKLGSHHIVGQDFCLQWSYGGQRIEVPASIIFFDKFAQLFYDAQNWRELWADGVHVDKVDGRMILKLASLHQQLYELDICFSFSQPFKEDSFFEVLWKVGGDIIVKVSQHFNEFTSPDGWTSRCYRISYKSFDKALHRNKIIEIHQNVIGTILSAKLGLKVH